MRSKIRDREGVLKVCADMDDPEARVARLAKLEEMEDLIFQQACQIVQAGLDFTQVKRDQSEPPPEWVAEFGRIGAEQRLEVAKAGWLPQSQAPSGLILAHRVQLGIARSRAHRVKTAQNNLNVTISLPAPASASHPEPGVEYPSKEIDQ